MSKETELLKECRLMLDNPINGTAGRNLQIKIKELLDQPEQEPVTDKPTETAMAVMPNGVCVSNVYDAYEEGRKSVMSEQEPVAWMYEWVNEIGEHVKSVVYNFYDDANLIPLYLAPPKREPLINIYVLNAFKADDEATHPYSYWAGVEFAEKHHGIGGEE